MKGRLDDGWDCYCVTVAKAHLFAFAAKTLVEAGAKRGVSPERVVEAKVMVAKVIARVNEAGKKKRQIDVEWTEVAFYNFMRHSLNIADDAADAIVARLKTEAMGLRGQLDLFEKASDP